MQDRRITLSTKAAFGIGQLAEGLMNFSFAALLLFYYNQVHELPPSLCGLALGVALLFDAITDPLAGSISDNWQGRLGRRHPFLYASAVPLGVSFYLLFSPPAALGPQGLFVWLVVFSVATRGAMTLYHVPHLALGAELTQNFEERTSIVAWRQAFGFLGALLVMVLAFGVFLTDARGGRTNAQAYPQYALLVSLLMVGTIVWSAWGTQKEIPFLPRADGAASGNTLGRLVREVTSAFQNVSFRWLFSGVLIVFLMVGVDAALFIYVNQYFWELSGIEMMLYGAVYPIGLVCGSPFVRRIHERFDKRPGLVLGTAGWAILQVLPILLRLAGHFPANDSELLLPALVALRFLQGIVVQQSLVSFGSMMADVADEHELESGRRQEGIFFGAVAFSGKAASGLGSMIAGVGLSLIAWPKGTEIVSAADVDPQTLVGLALLYGPIVSAFAVASVWCYAHYSLNRARHAEILAELHKQRREGPRVAISGEAAS